MATGFSSANIVTGILNLFRATNFTAPTTLYAKLHVGDPGAAGTANPSAGSTTRNSFTFAAPSSNAIALSSPPAAWTNGGTNETLTHVSVWDAATSGNFLFSFLLATPQPWASGNTANLGTLTIAAGPVAA